MNSRNRVNRTTPSIRLNMICPPSAGLSFLSSVAATSGRYLYMKIKKASEMMTLPAASQLLMAAAFSRACAFTDSEVDGSPSLRRNGRGGRLYMVGFVLHHVFDGNVGREAQSAVAQGHGVTERHDPTDDGPGHPFVLFRRSLDRFAHRDHFTRRLAAGDRPGVWRAHHYAFEHGLAADQRLLATFKRRQKLHGHQKT